MFRILIDAREISEEINFKTRALKSILPKFLQPQVNNAPRDRTDLPHLPPFQAQAHNLHGIEVHVMAVTMTAETMTAAANMSCLQRAD